MPRVQDYKDTTSSSKEMIVFYLANTFMNNYFLLIKMGVVWAWLLFFLPIKAAPPTDRPAFEEHSRVTGNQVFLLDGLTSKINIQN